MKRTFIVITLALVLIASIAVAQQRRGPATPPALGTPQTFTGTVVSFTATPGTMHPALVATDGAVQKSFVLGPYWFLAESKFAAAAGDRVTIISLACSECLSGDAVVSVTNQSNGTKVVLRDANGLPLWQNVNGHGAGNSGYGPAGGQHNGGGMGAGYGSCGGLLPDVARKASFEGTVVSFTGGPGVGEPELTLATAAGNKVFVPAPYRVILDAGYTFTTGAKLVLTAAPVNHDGEEEWVIITMKDIATGLEITFRDAAGYPLGTHGYGQHGRP